MRKQIKVNTVDQAVNSRVEFVLHEYLFVGFDRRATKRNNFN